jgi:hypothetical protein
VGPYLPVPTSSAKWDIGLAITPRTARTDRWLTRHLRLGVDQPTQAGAGALGDLAVLLERPPEPATELGAVDARELAGQNETLVGGEERREPRHPPQPQPVGHERVNLRAGVGELDLLPTGVSQRKGPLEGGLQWTATRKRAAAIVNAGEEALLEHVGQVLTAGEPLARARVRKQLEHSLAHTVLQILPSQPMAVSPQ